MCWDPMNLGVHLVGNDNNNVGEDPDVTTGIGDPHIQNV
jgi:hypothetical protein